jgi:hypothetical protein
MNKPLITILGIAALLTVGATLAQDAKAPAQAPKASQPATGTDAKAQMAGMDEHMKKMQGLHDKMMSAATPEERQKAMEEARKEMQASMATMQPMMQGGGMMGGGMMGGGGGMTAQKGAPSINPQMQMMEKRMDMMQMMMQMMMDQQGMMGPPKASGATPQK